MSEPLESRKRRHVIKPALKQNAPPAIKQNAPPKEVDTSLLFGCEAIEVAANAIITSIVGGVAEPDLAHTGAIRLAVQLLHSIGTNPTKKRNYKELSKLIDTLEAYNINSEP